MNRRSLSFALCLSAFGLSLVTPSEGANTRRTLGPSQEWLNNHHKQSAEAQAPDAEPVKLAQASTPAPSSDNTVLPIIVTIGPEAAAPATQPSTPATPLIATEHEGANAAATQPTTIAASPKTTLEVTPAETKSEAPSASEQKPAASEASPHPASIEAPKPTPVLPPLDKEIARLRALPAPQIPMRGVPLHEVLSSIVRYAGIKCFAPPDKDFAETVSMTIPEVSTYDFLELLQKRYGFEMEYNGAMWEFFKVSPTEIICRSYTIRFTNMAEIKSNNSSNDSGDTSASQTTANGSGSGGYTQASTGSHSKVFESSYAQITKEIQGLIGIPITGTGTLNTTPGSVGTITPIPGQAVFEQKATATGEQVFPHPDTNSLLVYATRQHHKYIEAYLRDFDRPMPLVRIETVIVDTQRDPRQFIGIDPSGYARPTVSLSDSSASTSSTTSSTTTTGSTSSGQSLTTPSINLNHPFGANGIRLPNAAVLSASSLSFQLNALQTDSDSQIQNRPTLITLQNREVSIESVIAEPYASSTTQNANSGMSNGNITTAIEKIKIGTIINVLPQILTDDSGQRSVLLNLKLTVSGKVGDKNVFGQMIPITSSRSYYYTVTVPDGYTLAIGGLDETSLTKGESKIPLAGDIPILGYLFKSKSTQKSHSNLIAYITPTIIDSGSGDIAPGQSRALPSYKQFLKEHPELASVERDAP